MRSRHLLPLAVAAVCLQSVGDMAARAAQSASADAYRETIPGTVVGFDMALVPEGSVMLAGNAVTVKSFYIGRTEVTWDMYDVFALGLDKSADQGAADAVARPSQPYGAPDYGWGHAGYPVISVTRTAAEAFCEWLSNKTGRKYRLPTEAEWLRAATLASHERPLTVEGRDAVAWHAGNSSARTHPVGTRKADALGLFDVFGNAAEWVITADGQRVTRGGSFRDPAETVGPTARATQQDSWNERDPQLPKSRWWLSDAPFVGFRIVRDP